MGKIHTGFKKGFGVSENPLRALICRKYLFFLKSDTLFPLRYDVSLGIPSLLYNYVPRLDALLTKLPFSPLQLCIPLDYPSPSIRLILQFF